MDKNLTDSEIVKAVKAYEEKILANGIKSLEPFEVRDIIQKQQEEINRQKAENERLKNFKAYFDFYYGCDVEILGIDENGDTTSFDEFYNCAIANAESIEHHIAHIIKTAKAEAYKEVIERIKEEFPNATSPFHNYGIEMYLDCLYKEMVGEDNEN